MNHVICVECWLENEQPIFSTAVKNVRCCYCGNGVDGGLRIWDTDYLDCEHHRNGIQLQGPVHRCPKCGILTNNPNSEYCFFHAYTTKEALKSAS